MLYIGIYFALNVIVLIGSFIENKKVHGSYVQGETKRVALTISTVLLLAGFPLFIYYKILTRD